MATIQAPIGASTSPFAAAWAAAVAAQQAGTAAPEAMYTIYLTFPPGTHGSQALRMAQICGYVWADSYWNNVEMNAEQLAADMQAAMQWDLSDCQLAAQQAFTQWGGVLVRKYYDDMAAIPYPGQYYYKSPDTICNGNNTLNFQQLLNNWNLYANQADPEAQNFLYARGQVVNFGAPIPSTKVQMFVSPNGFGLGPNSWQACAPPASTALTLADGKTTVLNAGDQAAVNGAFTWQDPSTAHFCAITAVETPFFTNNPLVITPSNWNSATWTLNNGAAGWNNLNTQTNVVEVLHFENQDFSSERFVFEARTTGVPHGTQITLSVDDHTLPAAISAVGTVHGDGHVATASGTIPPRFKGKLNVAIHVPGAKGELLPADAQVALRLLWELPPGHPYHFASYKRFSGARNAPQYYPLGDYTIQGTN